MNRKFVTRLLASVVLFYALCATNLWGQCPLDVAAVGLQAPTKIIAGAGNLLIAEAGFGPNQGRISVLNPTNGEVRTLVSGLPSGFSPPNSDPSGPSGLALVGNTLYLSIGLGDAIVAGPVPNTQIANPNPSSPLFSSVLAIDLGAQGKSFHGDFSLTLGNQATLANHQPVKLRNANGDTITIRLVANFPDYIPEPTPDEPNNVRQSNPFGVVAIDNYLYVPDASSNNLRVVDLRTGSFRTLTTFAPLPNPLPFGAPTVEAVPNSVRRFGDSLLVTLLTGFPFPPGGAKVVVVDPKTGNQTPLITGLWSAIDVMPVRIKGKASLLTLEFSTDMLNGDPGRLSLYTTPTAAPVTLANCLITPTSMAQDKASGQIYFVEIFTGLVKRMTLP
jgi:hypothetical protein